LSGFGVGRVVTPAQPLLVLVPQGSHLEIEAMVSNRDVGFVEPGQEAEIKVATFNFTRYGLMHRTVLSISPDAVGKDDLQGQTKDKSQPAAQDAKPPSDDQGPVYVARISLDRTRDLTAPGGPASRRYPAGTRCRQPQARSGSSQGSGL
jgi:hemolysin D